MCKLCDGVWLTGYKNTRWGMKHFGYDKRSPWRTHYNEYFPKFYLQRVNRGVIYIEKENNNKRFR